MIDGQRDITLFEVADDIIQILLRSPPGRDDGWTASGCNFLDQRPVIHVGAGNLEDRHVEFDAQVNRRLIEGRGHRNATQISDLFNHPGKFVLAEPGILGLLDIAQFGRALEIGVNELIHVPELQLDGGLDVVETRDRTMVADDFQPTFKLAPVVIGKFENEQVFKQVLITLADGFHEYSRCSFVLLN
ncbi:hypothetical protein D3C72_1056080 [compost metagenome]